MKPLSKKKIKDRRKKGIVKAYMSRAAAIRQLQVSLSDFRRLCILKGVYPVEPRNKSQLTGANTRRKTYFFTRDVQSLVNEPILYKFAEFKAFMKRITRAKGRHDREAFDKQMENKPFYKLDTVVKERYPRFVDALRDCDDALSMCSLYGMFPKGPGRPDELIDLSRQLITEFEKYIIESRSLRKVFISIKGYYYQAEVMGQTITWMVPHQFVIDRVSNVDLNVMKTFTEFYVTCLGFINFKLHKSLTKSNATEQQQPDVFEEELGNKTTSVHDIMLLERLFEGLKIFLNREVPRESLVFVIRSFGGKVSWDKILAPGATFDESDPSITHQIVDRPNMTERRLNRIYIQPQWIYDSINMRMLLPTTEYLIGATLPPHLSPFVSEKRGDYVPPDKIKMVNLRKQFEAEKASEKLVNNGEMGVESELETDHELESEVSHERKEKQDKNLRKRERDSNKSTSRSKMTVKTGKLRVEDKEEAAKKEDAEYRKMGIMMIPKKRKRLFDKITRTQKERSQKTEKLRNKRRIVDAVRSRRKAE